MGSNRRILDDFRRLAGEQPGVKLVPRTPLILEITDRNGNLEEIGWFYVGLLLVPCAVQVLFCFLVRKKSLKCILVYIVAVGFVLNILVILGVFSDIEL